LKGPNQSRVTVVFAGGGTGGHLYPAIAIADALRARARRIAFIGTADRLEATIVPQAGYDLHAIDSHSLPRRPSLELLQTIASNLKGTVQSLGLLAKERPDIVIATGGYVSFPVALAARIARLARLSHAALVLLEPNAEAGLTNRMLMPLVDEVWGPPLHARRRPGAKYQTTGVPVRTALRSLPERNAAIARLGLDPSLRTLVAMGGSQGARSINDALARLVEQSAMPPGWQLLALTGRADYERIRAALPHARPYLDDMADAYAVADLVLARAGASTLGELAALGKPSILVPYPHAAENHQAANAARFEAAGAAVVLRDREMATSLASLLSHTAEPKRLQALADGAKSLAGADPLNAILARIDVLTSRKSKTS
jgi:UDP-N-acetylglucosamine--N-acetylmuramyl-(pentapeptide) pyrophosphoryl-undecaprenol N-acetylglucosamine transferase